MGNMKGLVTLIFQDRKYKFGKLGYFDANFSKSYIFPNLKLLLRQYDVIIGIFQSPVPLPFLKVEAQNLVSWGILTCSLKFQHFISIISFADTL